jgi:hypothetical protein
MAPNRWTPCGFAPAFAEGARQDLFDVFNSQIMFRNMLDVALRIVLAVPYDA